jgi:16S rRNA processing protein RimM
MLLVVARVGRAHGVKGEVAVEVRTDEPETRLAVGAVLVTDPPIRGPLTVRSAREHSGRLLVRFAGVDDRTEAEALRGTLLQVDVDPARTPVEDDAWYDHQLVGLAVVDLTGAPVGEVRAVLHLPAQDLLAVVRPDGSEVLVPFVAEIVPDVDLAAGRVVVDPPPGLLDESEAVIAGDAPAGDARAADAMAEREA